MISWIYLLCAVLNYKNDKLCMLILLCMASEMILSSLYFDSLWLFMVYSFVLSIQIYLVYRIKIVHSVYIYSILAVAVLTNLLIFIDEPAVSWAAYDYHQSIMLALTCLELLVLGLYSHGARLFMDISKHDARFASNGKNNLRSMVAV